MSLDGYFTDEDGSPKPDWFTDDPELDKWMMSDHGNNAFMKPSAYIFGRTTYEQFANIWPKMVTQEDIPKDIKQMAISLTKMKKYVFSSTMKKTNWENSFVIKGNLLEEVQKLKQENDGDFLIFGSGTIVQQLTTAHLIDDYLLIVSPIVLGKGKSLFKNTRKTNFKLNQTVSFPSGNVLLHYKIIP